MSDTDEFEEAFQAAVAHLWKAMDVLYLSEYTSLEGDWSEAINEARQTWTPPPIGDENKLLPHV
jgi:hypothetical protein